MANAQVKRGAQAISTEAAMPCQKKTRGGDATSLESTEQWIKKAAAAKAKYQHPDYKGLVTLAPHEVGVHPRNRDGAGLHWLRVHELGAEILHLGCDVDEPQGGCCVAEAPGSHLILNYNMALVKDEPHFPPVDAAMRFGSLEHSHVNTFLRCVAASCPSPCQSLTSDGETVMQCHCGQRCPICRPGANWSALVCVVPCHQR